MGLIRDVEFPDHPLWERIAEEMKPSNSEEKDKGEVEDATEYEDKYLEEDEDASSSDRTVVEKRVAPLTDREKSDEDEISQEVKFTVRQLLAGGLEKAKSIKKSKMKEKTSASKHSEPSGGTSQLWELKKVLKRIEAVEEELNSIVNTVDDLQEWKEAKTKRSRLLEGETDSSYSGPTVGREEFEDTIIELSEAVGFVRMKQREQKENWDAVNQDILKELEIKTTREEMNQSKEEVNKKLNILSNAIRSIQEILNDVIYPEACGVSKCMCCKHKAHIPSSGLIMGNKKRFLEGSTKSNINRTSNVKQTGNVTRDTKTPDKLQFTTTRLKRLIGEDGMRKMLQARPSESPKQVEVDQQSERPIITMPLINLETFELTNLTKGFAPLRPFPDTSNYRCINLPDIRPKKAPSTIQVRPREAKNFKKKFPEKEKKLLHRSEV